MMPSQDPTLLASQPVCITPAARAADSSTDRAGDSSPCVSRDVLVLDAETLEVIGFDTVVVRDRDRTEA